MTSPTQRAGADDPKALLVRTSINLAKTVEALQSENAALQARIAELEARNAASERDAGRYRWLRSMFSNNHFLDYMDAVEAEIGDDEVDAAIDAHAQGQAGEE